LAFSEKQIQFIKAETCGFFAISMLLYLNRNKNKNIYDNASAFISKFSYDTEDNNTLLKKYFRALPDSKNLKLLNKLYSEK
jgi:hypothetical protein